VNAVVEGFAQFVVARERALQRTAWLLTGDWALAGDLVQTALVRSWPRWERIRRRDDPEIYVRRVMVNTWVSGRPLLGSGRARIRPGAAADDQQQRRPGQPPHAHHLVGRSGLASGSPGSG